VGWRPGRGAKKVQDAPPLPGRSSRPLKRSSSSYRP
jgi:hypothetical protein